MLRHSLTGVPLKHLLKTFSEYFPGLVPVTTCLFRKDYGQYGNDEPHFYCLACGNYNNTNELQCGACYTVNTEYSLKNECFFLVSSLSSLASQIKELGELDEGNISLICNCYRIPVFRSSKYQIWPLNASL